MQKVKIMKILTVLSFLLIIIPDDTLVMPLGMYLIIYLIQFITEMKIVFTAPFKLIETLLIMVSMGFLLISNFRKLNNQTRNNWLSLFSIIILMVYFAMIVKNLFYYHILISSVTCVIFFTISVTTTILIIRRLKQSSLIEKSF